MRQPNNPSAELIADLEKANDVLIHKLTVAEQSYQEFMSTTRAELDKNIQVIATLEPVAEWIIVPDPVS